MTIYCFTCMCVIDVWQQTWDCMNVKKMNDRRRTKIVRFLRCPARIPRCGGPCSVQCRPLSGTRWYCRLMGLFLIMAIIVSNWGVTCIFLSCMWNTNILAHNTTTHNTITHHCREMRTFVYHRVIRIYNMTYMTTTCFTNLNPIPLPFIALLLSCR